jgi:uncharacterized paraquat-inducible protein A
MDWRPSNRDRARQPKLGLGWCHSCDASLVGWGSKCPRCGTRNGDRKEKKPLF